MANLVRATSLSAVKDPLRSSFKNFMYKTWRSLGYPDPTAIHYEFADWLQYGPDKLIGMGFRGLAKSYITVTFGNWGLYCDPEEAIILTVSATTTAAKQNSTFAWQMIQGFDWLAHLRPSPDQRQATMAFDVRGAKPKKMESFRAESLFGQITSCRAKLIIADDVEIPNTSDTESKRADLEQRHGELSGAILLPGGREVVLGTAQCEQTLYAKLATSKGYGMRMWPIVYPSEEELPKFGSWLAPTIEAAVKRNPELAGHSTEPTRFTDEDIARREEVWGRTEFARQFKLHLDAGVGNTMPLKVRDFVIHEWAPPSVQPDGSRSKLLLPPDVRWGPSKENLLSDIEVDALTGDHLYGPLLVSKPEDYRLVETSWMYIDPSGAGDDETVAIPGSGLGAFVFVHDLESWLEGHNENTLRGIAKLAYTWNVGYIFVESNFGQGMFASILRPYLMEVQQPCIIEEDRKGGLFKERRIIETLEPPLTAHRIVLNRRIAEKDMASGAYPQVEDSKRRFYRLFYQLTRLQKIKGCLAHDDKGDCLASLIAKFANRLQQTIANAGELEREKARMEEIQKLIALRKAQGLPTFGAELEGIPFGRGSGGGMSGSNFMGRKRQR